MRGVGGESCECRMCNSFVTGSFEIRRRMALACARCTTAGAATGDVEERQEDQKTEKGVEGAQGRIAQAQIAAPQAHHGGKGQIAAATETQAAGAVTGAGTPGRRHAVLDVHGIEKRLGRAQRRAALGKREPEFLLLVERS